MTAPPGSAPPAAAEAPIAAAPAPPILDGRYTFESFVVGSGNRLAYAAAKSAAESPGENYSPLLIYSDSGLGKTHLLGAIGRHVLLARPDLEVRYASIESLVGELLACIARGDREKFRAGLAAIDVLLIDDLQFLAGHPETQEELLYALDASGRGKGQIVLTSDRGPEEIEALDERMLARFRGGLVVDVQNPDYETRAAILRFKIKEQGEEFSPEVVDELALRAFSNIRELEGALHKLIVLRAMHGGRLTASRVRDLLRRSLPPRSGEEDAGEFGEFLSEVAETLSSVLPLAPAAVTPEPVKPEPLEPLRPPLPEYRFTGWIAGPSNRLATESARRVLAEPGTRWNPLFLHGATGMGKTHLLNALGNAFLESCPGASVCYRSAEEFTDELITAIQKGSLARLRARYRGADMLLLDDIHSLTGRERTQEEFFHVFNELFSGKHQIVLTSDRPPRELEGLEARLVSRFEGGLVVEIEPLDEATAAPALAAFLGAEGFALDGDLAVELVQRLLPENMREIQGLAKRAALRADSAGLPKDAAFLRRILLHARPEGRAAPAGRVDPFFTDAYKVFLHWEPPADRLVERM